ncbi:MAG: SRPBCC family protein [Chthoniobacteraceae bacterium]
MESIKRSIEVHAPVEEAYGRWTHIEDFPLFMRSLREVRRVGERRFYWRAEREGIAYESVEEISLMIPNHRIAWRNVSGSENSGVVTFEELGPELTFVTLDLAYEPDSGWHEPYALAERIELTLDAFRDLVEPSFMEELVAHNWQGF